MDQQRNDRHGCIININPLTPCPDASRAFSPGAGMVLGDFFLEIEMPICPVDQSLTAHLARVEAAEIASEQADEQLKELLSPGGDCYPFDHDNLCEAISLIDIGLITKALQAGDYEAAGRALASEVTQFWKNEARTRNR